MPNQRPWYVKPCLYASGHMKDPVPLVENSRASCPGIVGFLRTEWVLHAPPFSYATGMPSESVSKIRPRNIREKRREKKTMRGTSPPYRDNRDEHRARADTCVTVLWPKSTNFLWRRISLLSRHGSGGGGLGGTCPLDLSQIGLTNRPQITVPPPPQPVCAPS